MSLRAYLIVYYLDSLKWKYFIHFDISVKVEYTPNFTNYFVNLFTFYNSYVTIKTKTISLQNYFQMQINKKYGYIRVSSRSQESNSSIKYQKEQLIQNGIQPENIRIEVESAINEIKNRLVFQKLIQEELKSNDLLMITKIDRCSRNTLEFLKYKYSF